jgi:PAS domain S-box-containing protein
MDHVSANDDGGLGASHAAPAVFRHIADAALTVLYVYDIVEGRSIWCSREITSALGYSQAELTAQLPRVVESLLHQDDLAGYRAHLASLNALKDGAIAEFQYRMRHADGSWRWLHSRDAVLDRENGGSVRRIIGSALDITERKEIEEDLRVSTHLLSTIYAGIKGAIALSEVIDNGREFRFLAVNAECSRWVGLPAEQQVGHTPHEIFPKELADAFTARYRLAVETGQSQTYEEKVAFVTGESWALTTATPVRDTDGVIRRIVATSIDITARKEAEAALQSVAEKYADQVRLFEAVASTTPDFVYIFDTGGRFVYANRRLLEVWGMTLEEAVGKTCFELGYQKWHHDMHMREIAQVISTKAPIKGEVPFKAPRTGIDGIYEYIFTPVFGADGEVELIAGTTRDVTDRKRAESLVQESEQRFRAMVMTTSDVIYRMSGDWSIMLPLDGRTLVASNDAPIADWMDRHVPDDERPRVRAAIQHALQTRTPFSLEHRVNRPDGTEGWTFSRAVPIVNEAGEITEWFGAAIDITEQRRRSENTVFLGELSDALANLGSIEEITAYVGSKLATQLKLDSCHFDQVSPESGRTTVPHEWRRTEQPPVVGEHRHEDFVTPEFLRSARAGDTLVVADAFSDPRTKPSAYAAVGIRSFVMVPFKTRGVWAHALAACCAKPRVWRDDEVELLREVAARVFPRLERARAEDELRRHREHLQTLVDERTRELQASHQKLRLAERMASLGTLAAGLGHDIGNLLLPLRIRLDLLEALPLPEGAEEEITGIRSSTDYLQKLASGLRALAVNADRPVATEPTELNLWWSESEAVLHTILPRTVTLQGTMCSTPCFVAVPKSSLTQAVFNLVQNAGDAMKTTGGGIVHVTARAEGGLVLLSVADTGPGMTAEVRERCMEPFFTTKTRGMSTGLGLALVHSIVEEAGGSVDITTELGKGTTFTLRLPVAAITGSQPAQPVARQAVVHIKDARTRAYIIAELKRKRFNVSTDGTLHTPELAITDDSDGVLSAAHVLRIAANARLSDVRELLQNNLS